MGTSKAKRAQVAGRRARALEMKTRGEPLEAIKDALGYSSIGAVSVDLGRALTANLSEQQQAADELRELELKRLDALYRAAWEVLEREHITVSGGKVITVTDETGAEHQLRDDGPTLAAIDRLLKVAERRARLLGLDSPVRVDAQGVVTFTIEGIDPEKLR